MSGAAKDVSKRTKHVKAEPVASTSATPEQKHKNEDLKVEGQQDADTPKKHKHHHKKVEETAAT